MHQMLLNNRKTKPQVGGEEASDSSRPVISCCMSLAYIRLHCHDIFWQFNTHTYINALHPRLSTVSTVSYLTVTFYTLSIDSGTKKNASCFTNILDILTKPTSFKHLTGYIWFYYCMLNMTIQI